ncbi:MAG TPA: DNA-3-methyladenine glycosylase I [Candidatus Saccharimonadales bacterium]|nr:DNA-3-methyladenine glycosylase I [Candidatus Saccharimonadales bacterium]HSX27487.1 DNA-3-methyladenine glycosylase I [Patescibacteria group bacterium]
MPNWDAKHGKIDKPKNDDEYFERMSRVIFVAGLNWRVLDNKWPGIKKAFKDFSIDKVAKFQEPEIEELMNDRDVIHNLAKIRAIIANAKEIQSIAKEHGSFANYLKSLGDEDTKVAALIKRFAFLGKGTTVIFLFASGEDMPKAHTEWHARHQGK